MGIEKGRGRRVDERTHTHTAKTGIVIAALFTVIAVFVFAFSFLARL